MKLLVIISFVISMAVLPATFAGENDAYELGGWMNASAEKQGACLKAREELELAEEYLEDATQEVMVQYAEKWSARVKLQFRSNAHLHRRVPTTPYRSTVSGMIF